MSKLLTFLRPAAYFCWFAFLLGVPGRNAAQNTLFDIIYCLNGGENKSAGIPKLTIPNPASKPGWNLIFSDEFQTGPLDKTRWNTSNPWDDGDGTCHRRFAMNPSNTSADTGYARVTNSGDSSLSTCPYSSGEIKSMSIRDTSFGSYFFYAPGYFETRVKLFTRTGQGAACWLWGYGTAGNPGIPGPWNEIDIFELNGVNNNIFNGTYHWTWNNVHVSQTYDAYLTDSTQFYDLGSEWTTFGLQWDTIAIRWFVNNTLIKELSMDVIPPFCVNAAHYTKPLAPFCIRFSTGPNTVGNQSGVPDPADFPQSMLVDYVRVYKKSGTKAAPIILQDSVYQVCASANSPGTSSKIIRTRYYPGAVYTWSSPAYDFTKITAPPPQPPEKMILWVKPGTTAGFTYPICLKTVFPGNYTEYDTAYIYLAADVPEVPPDNFSAAQIDSSCYFSIITPAGPGISHCDYSLDLGVTWADGIPVRKGGTEVFSFGRFKPGQPVSFAFREHNACGSAARNSSLIMPPPPAGCKWPAGIDERGSSRSGEDAHMISISPNPVTDLMEIRYSPGFHPPEGTMHLRIFDVCARMILEKTLPAEGMILDLPMLHPGMHCLVISGDKGPCYKSTFIKR